MPVSNEGRGHKSRKNQQEQANDLHSQSREELSALIHAGIGSINRQVAGFDTALTTIEEAAADVLYQRYQESPVRIAILLVNKLKAEPVQANSLAVLFEDLEPAYLEMPQLIPAPYAGVLGGAA